MILNSRKLKARCFLDPGTRIPHELRFLAGPFPSETLQEKCDCIPYCTLVIVAA
jgi:hypothetical protein